MRLFVGVKPGREVERRGTEGLERLKALAPRAKWVVPEKLHLTLSFLGEVETERAEAVARALEAVGTKHGPLVLKIEGGGSFGAPGHPRVLWAGVTGDTQALESLQMAVVSALEPLGFAAEERDYTAHLTLARARTPRGDRELAACVQALEGERWGEGRVDTLILFESTGGRYTPRAEVPLAGPGRHSSPEPS